MKKKIIMLILSLVLLTPNMTTLSRAEKDSQTEMNLLDDDFKDYLETKENYNQHNKEIKIYEDLVRFYRIKKDDKKQKENEKNLTLAEYNKQQIVNKINEYKWESIYKRTKAYNSFNVYKDIKKIDPNYSLFLTHILFFTSVFLVIVFAGLAQYFYHKIHKGNEYRKCYIISLISSVFVWVFISNIF